MRISDWSSDVCSSDLLAALHLVGAFSLADGRMFDAVTTREDGRAPRVVLIEQAAARAEQDDALERRLAQLGVKRIGYLFPRSEERRVGKELGRTCRSRWWPYH